MHRTEERQVFEEAELQLKKMKIIKNILMGKAVFVFYKLISYVFCGNCVKFVTWRFLHLPCFHLQSGEIRAEEIFMFTSFIIEEKQRRK